MADVSDKAEYGTLGQEVQMEHIKAYLAKPSGAADKAVVLAGDIYGWKNPSNRYLADMLAANGYITVLPDLFGGKEAWGPTHDWSKIQNWLDDKSASGCVKEMDAVVNFLKDQCHAKSMGIVGYNWGGTVAHYAALNYATVKASVSIYGLLKEGNIHELKSPTLFIFGEKDTVIPLAQVSAFEAKLKEKCATDYQVKIYPGQVHGFFNRKREDISPTDKTRIQEARKDAINWLNKYM